MVKVMSIKGWVARAGRLITSWALSLGFLKLSNTKEYVLVVVIITYKLCVNLIF